MLSLRLSGPGMGTSTSSRSTPCLCPFFTGKVTPRYSRRRPLPVLVACYALPSLGPPRPLSTFDVHGLISGSGGESGTFRNELVQILDCPTISPPLTCTLSLYLSLPRSSDSSSFPDPTGTDPTSPPPEKVTFSSFSLCPRYPKSRPSSLRIVCRRQQGQLRPSF